jgi:hypothetical protein
LFVIRLVFTRQLLESVRPGLGMRSGVEDRSGEVSHAASSGD